jgi:hypothetical protein
LKKPDLDEEQVEERGQNRPNKGQPTASPNEHNNCKDLKIIYRSGRTNSHWPFVGTGKNVVRGRERNFRGKNLRKLIGHNRLPAGPSSAHDPDLAKPFCPFESPHFQLCLFVIYTVNWSLVSSIKEKSNYQQYAE